MPPRQQPSLVSRRVALCYIRQSYTRNPNDMDSPDRQRANIEAVVRAKGWLPEWYSDAEGHKSGTKEHNRPGWLALQKRLIDPDVIAIVANDLARLHRKGWRVGRLVDMLEEHNVFLVLAAPGRELDLSKPQDRIAIQIIAMMDEWYAVDASIRQKDNILHRKSLGKSVGLPPFGSFRDETGYLVPSTYGAWHLPDGSHISGKEGEVPPQDGAVWRSYFAAAERVLTLYAENKRGREHIAILMNREGWAYRDRNGNPRPFGADDIRRITANWSEYAGLVVGGRAKDRAPDVDKGAQEMLMETGHNVLDIALLRHVASVRAERTVVTNKISPKQDAHDYALTGILYCAHCEQDAREKNNAKLRATISGHGFDGNLRYRHKEGHPCRAVHRSVSAADVENDFARLITLLTIDEEALPLMTELAIQSQRRDMVRENGIDPEEEKKQAIARCRRRIDATRNLYEDGDLSREDYLRRKEDNEREIAHWQARTIETEQAALELALCMETVAKLSHLWDAASDEDRQGMAQSLFETIVYDLDTQRIVDFRLKPWADRFLVLRAALYDDTPDEPEGGDSGGNNSGNEPVAESSTVLRLESPVGAQIAPILENAFPPEGVSFSRIEFITPSMV